MKPIPATFTANGFVHEQLERTGNLAIYRRFAIAGGKEHFEVVRIKSHNGFKIPKSDKMAPPAETYPSNESWGRDGFTLPDLASARAKLAELSGEGAGT